MVSYGKISGCTCGMNLESHRPTISHSRRRFQTYVTAHLVSSSRSQLRIQTRCYAAAGEAEGESSEKFVSIQSLLSEVNSLGKNMVFEDTDEDADVWNFESRVASSAYAEPSEDPQPAIKNALDPEQAAIDSAYSVEQGFQEVSVETLKADMAAGKGMTVLDVRTAEEFRSGHVPGAVHVCMDELSERVKTGGLDQYREGLLAVVCQSGRRSAQSAVRLTKVFGFDRVVNVKGGTSAWASAGFDLEY